MSSLKIIQWTLMLVFVEILLCAQTSVNIAFPSVDMWWVGELLVRGNGNVIITSDSLLWFVYRCIGPGLEGCQTKGWVVLCCLRMHMLCTSCWFNSRMLNQIWNRPPPLLSDEDQVSPWSQPVWSVGCWLFWSRACPSSCCFADATSRGRGPRAGCSKRDRYHGRDESPCSQGDVNISREVSGSRRRWMLRSQLFYSSIFDLIFVCSLKYWFAPVDWWTFTYQFLVPPAGWASDSERRGTEPGAAADPERAGVQENQSAGVRGVWHSL